MDYLVDGGARSQSLDGRSRPDPSGLWRRYGHGRLRLGASRACGRAVRVCNDRRRNDQRVCRHHLRRCGIAGEGPLSRHGDPGDAVHRRFRHFTRPDDKRRYPGNHPGPCGTLPRNPGRRRSSDLLCRSHYLFERNGLHSQCRANEPRSSAGRGARKGLRGRNHWREYVQIQTAGFLGQFIHRGRGGFGIRGLLSTGNFPGPISYRTIHPTRRHGDRGRAGKRAWLVFRRGADPVRADRSQQSHRRHR